MKTKNQIFTLATLLATATTVAIAEEDAVSKLTTPSSSVSIGVGHVSGEREQFGVFDNVRDDETLLLLDADVNKRDDTTGTWTTFKARNLGVDNRTFEFGYERQGNWGINLDYNQIPYVSPYTVNSGITGLGTETQTVTNITPGAGTNIDLGMERQRTGLEFYKYLRPNLNFKVSLKNEEKNGDRHWGRGGAPEFAAEPIDFTTQTMEATLNFADKQLQLSGGYIGNWYKNHNDHVTSIGASTYELSLPFSNEAHQIFLNGGYSFDSTTRGTFRLSYTHASVNEAIPASIAALAYAGAPTRLDGDINTTLMFIGLTSRPMQNLSLVANLRYHKVDEQTPASLIVCTGACDGGAASSEVKSTPLDYKTLSGKLEGTYRLQDGYSVIAGIDIKQQDRSLFPYGNDNDGLGADNERYVPWRTNLDEMTYRVQLRKSMSDTANGSLAFLHSKRDGSSYTQALHSEPGEGLLPSSIDPINSSDRERNKLRATVDWAPTDRANLTFNLEASKDDYSGHTLGLRDGNAQLASVDGSYALSKDWQMTGWLSHDRTKAEQHNFRAASGGYSEAEMYATLKDIGNSVGLGLNGKVNEKLKMGGNLEWTRTRSSYGQDLVTTGAGTLYHADATGPLPDIESTATKLDLFTEYAVAKNADVRFDLIYQQWKTNDWTWEFSDGTSFAYDGTNGAGTSDGTRVTADPNQSATFVGIRYIYKF